jgi:protein-tyrosine phosphatase
MENKYCAHYSRIEIEELADHAGEIARFVREHWNRTIIVHCEMGLSRSAAVCDVLVALGWEYVPTRSEGRRLANKRLVQLLQGQLRG